MHVIQITHKTVFAIDHIYFPHPINYNLMHLESIFNFPVCHKAIGARFNATICITSGEWMLQLDRLMFWATSWLLQQHVNTIIITIMLVQTVEGVALIIVQNQTGTKQKTVIL